jgi:ABC-2 type transport system permease protein
MKISVAQCLAHANAELRQLCRSPGYLVPTLVFPAMLFSFFAIGPANRYPEAAAVLLASWSVYAALGIAFYQFGVGFAQQREMHWSTYLRTLPAGPAPRLMAQLLVAVIFSALAIGVLWLVAFATTPVSLTTGQFWRLLAALSLGTIPFAALGIAIGYSVSAKAAVPVANLLYLPMAFAGGLWLRPSQLPPLMQEFSPYVPTRMIGEIVWAIVGDSDVPLTEMAGLAAYGFVFLAFAVWRYQTEDRKRFR